MSEVASELQRFEEALAAGRRRAAYEAARAAWRACRAPELAALVERAAERFTALELPSSKTPKAFMEPWLERARQREPYEGRKLLRVLDELARARGGSHVFAACLDELVSEADDPSLTLPACDLLGLPGGWGKVLTRLFTIIEKSGDPRALEALNALMADAKQDPEARGVPTSQQLVERIPTTLARLAKRVPPELPALDPAIRARAREALGLLERDVREPVNERSGEPTTEDALFAAVLADLDDHAARAVWADALQQRGDPRGDLIALQGAGTPAAAKKAEKLIKAHWRTWVGPLAPAIVASSVAFDRGLLDACTTDVRRKAVADAIFGHPLWATVRRLGFGPYGNLTAMMQRLEEALNVPLSGLEPLATITLPRLRVLSVRANVGHGGDGLVAGKPVGRGLKALAETRRLPALRALTLALWEQDLGRREPGGAFHDRRAPDYAWVFAAPIGAKLEEFGIFGDWMDWPKDALAGWVELFRGSAPSLRRFEVRSTDEVRLVTSLDEGTGTFDIWSHTTKWRSQVREAAQRLVHGAGLRFTG
jgi:uncharacterized protein (TIGR02996 family)